jgi:hypothetical protein
MLLLSVRAFRNELITPAQKAGQIGAVWLLPFVGALAVLQLPYLRNVPYAPGNQPIGGDGGGLEGTTDFGGFDCGDGGGDGDG